MKFIRAELHNHSTESDGALSVESLAAYAAEKNFGVLALTDHNTTSGHAKAYDAIRRAGYALALLPGVEITTFFGHILALGLVQMPDITTLDPRAPEITSIPMSSPGATDSNGGIMCSPRHSLYNPSAHRWCWLLL